MLHVFVRSDLPGWENGERHGGIALLSEAKADSEKL